MKSDDVGVLREVQRNTRMAMKARTDTRLHLIFISGNLFRTLILRRLFIRSVIHRNAFKIINVFYDRKSL